MTSVFVLTFCLTARILFEYLLKTYKFFGSLLQVMTSTKIVFGILSIAAAVWTLAMLVWILVKEFTGIKSIENPVIDKYIPKRKGSAKKDKKDDVETFDPYYGYDGYDWNDYNDGGGGQ